MTDQAIAEATMEMLLKHAFVPHLKKSVRLVNAIATKNEKRSKKGVERIHRLRTETRRVDVALRLFADWLPSGRTDGIGHLLKDIRKKAGSVRDLDVLLPLLEDVNARIRKSAMKWVMKRAKEFRAQEMHSLKLECQRLMKHGLEGQARSSQRHMAWQKTTAEPDIREFSVNAIHRCTTKLFSKVELLKDDAQQLHRVRICAKHLRYMLDLLTDVFSEPQVKVATAKLSEVQDTLGQVNDQMFVMTFLKMSVSECEHKSIALALRKGIEILEISTADHVRSAIRHTLDQVDHLQSLLTAVASGL